MLNKLIILISGVDYMTKEKWIEELKNRLKGLSKEEIDEIVADYNEYFYDAMQSGRSEDEIAEALGEPKKLAKQFKADSTIKQAQADMNPKNVLKAIFAIVTLSVFNIVVMAGPIMGVLGLIFGGTVAGVGVLGGGILGFFGVLLFGSKAFVGLSFSLILLISILLGLCLVSLGIVILIADFWFGKWVFGILVKYFRFNFDIIKKTAN